MLAYFCTLFRKKRYKIKWERVKSMRKTLVLACILSILGIGVSLLLLGVGARACIDGISDIHAKNETEYSENRVKEFRRYEGNIVKGEDVLKTLNYLDKRAYIVLISRLDHTSEKEGQAENTQQEEGTEQTKTKKAQTFKNYNIEATGTVELNKEETEWVYKGKVDVNSYLNYGELANPESEYYIKENDIFKSKLIKNTENEIVGVVFEEI